MEYFFLRLCFFVFKMSTDERIGFKAQMNSVETRLLGIFGTNAEQSLEELEAQYLSDTFHQKAT